MNTTKIVSFLILIFILFIVSILHLRSNKSQKNDIKENLWVETYKVAENEWGYTILLGEKIIIKQEIIPAVQNNIPFKTEADAKKMGMYVLSKIKNHQRPTITKQEIDSLNISLN